MIKTLEINNFKAFKNSGKVDLKKINILVGPNSSGKSSFIKSLLALKNTIDSSEKEPAIQFNKEIGNYKSVVYGHKNSEKVGFNIEFLNKNATKTKMGTYKVDLDTFTIANAIQEKTPQIQEGEDNIRAELLGELLKNNMKYIINDISFFIKITKSDRVVTDKFIINFENGETSEIFMKRNSYYIKFNNEILRTPNLITPNKFYFDINNDKLEKADINELEKLSIIISAMRHIKNNIRKFTDNVIHIEPFRNKPDRVEYLTNFKKINTVGSKGENILTSLLSLSNDKDEDNDLENKINDKINLWLNEFDLAENIRIQQLGNDNYSINIKNKYTGVECNILDVGVGTSQLLPIIIESVCSKENSILVIEEPETHIHPNAQSNLADLFVKCCKDQDKRFIIETHSIFLVTQLEILVASNQIDASDVGIYYFLQDKNGTKVIDMKMMDNGQFKEEWPSGFFDVNYKLGKKLFKLM